MKRKLDSGTIFIVILSFILFLSPETSFAQQLFFSPRENIIFTTLNQLQDREEAIRDAMKDAQMKLIEREVTKAKPRVRISSATALAQRIHPHPYLNTGIQFNDNVDQDRVLRKSAITYTSRPGLKFNVLGINKFSTVDLYIDNAYYNNRSRDNTQSAKIDVLHSFNLGRYNLSIKEEYTNTHIAQSHFGIDKNTAVHSWTHSFNPVVRTNFNRLDFNIGYKRTDYDAETDYSAGDYHEDQFAVNQDLSLTRKLSLSFEYIHTRKQHTKPLQAPGNSITDKIGLSLSDILSSKTTGSLGVIYETVDPKEGATKKATTFSVDGGYRITNRSDMGFSIQYLRTRYSQVKVSDTDNYTFSLQGSHRLALNPKFTLSLGYARNYIDAFKEEDSDEETRQDTLFFTLGYAFRQWLDFSLNYNYAKTRKNFAPQYYVNIISLTTEARF